MMKSAIPLLIILMVQIPNVDAHSLFNSAEQTVGNNRVQIATLPEFPNVGESAQILIRVTDRDYNELDRFTLGIRIFYNDQQIDTIRPQAVDGSHLELDYIFERSGNHIFRIDLYNAADNGGVITYSFNLSTQSPFGYIFFASIITGSIILLIVVTYVYVSKWYKNRSNNSVRFMR